MNAARPTSAVSFRARRGSVLIIVMWICLGVVALTLYFANSMSSDLRAADNRASDIDARQAVAGATRYAAYVLTNYAVNGAVPDPNSVDPNFPYLAENLPVGEAHFWFIGRDPNLAPAADPVFGLVDESSKLNLNTATSAMLQGLPNMTPDLAAAIIAWRSSRAQTSTSGSASNTYATLDPPRLNKGAAFESVDELRLVYGCTLDLLLGEDTNRNGALDPNEDDGDLSPPHDNQDGILQPGFLEYVTVYSKLPTTRASGGARINITTAQGRQGLRAIMRTAGIQPARITAILDNVDRAGAAPLTTVADFMVLSRMTADEFALIHTDITDGQSNQGRVNVNTASATVLACIPGIGPDLAASLVAYRVANPTALTSMAWLTAAGMTTGNIRRAGLYITDQSYQFSADIAAVGRYGRGYCREKVVFDTSRGGTPRIVYHQDLSSYGWAIGPTARQALKTAQNTPTSS